SRGAPVGGEALEVTGFVAGGDGTRNRADLSALGVEGIRLKVERFVDRSEDKRLAVRRNGSPTVGTTTDSQRLGRSARGPFVKVEGNHPQRIVSARLTTRIDERIEPHRPGRTFAAG